MLSKEENDRLTCVGPGTAMGDYLRRYWHPVAGISEFETRATKPIRLFGEDLVMFRDLSGNFGLVQRRCPHRGADLAYGMIEENGLRCNYHGWCFDKQGTCVEQPFEDVVRGGSAGRGNVSAKAYPVEQKAGMLWTYMGPQPAPLLPDWDPFSWPNGFTQVVISEVPCNWFQCQENSIDPVHFEWMHENWGQRLAGRDGPKPPRHQKLDFQEFDYGFTYHRVKEDTDEQDEIWTVGRVFLWPNGFFLPEHFEWRVPIDDENTLSVTWKYSRVPQDREPYHQERVPAWHGPTHDEAGEWITSHVMNQDFLAWAGQGRIADRTQESLNLSDKGIVMIRRRFFQELREVAEGNDPKGLIRDPGLNKAVRLPCAGRENLLAGYTAEQLERNPRLKIAIGTYFLQSGQPEDVKAEFEKAMGFRVAEFEGLT